jgi:hypothetical protein
MQEKIEARVEANQEKTGHDGHHHKHQPRNAEHLNKTPDKKK